MLQNNDDDTIGIHPLKISSLSCLEFPGYLKGVELQKQSRIRQKNQNIIHSLSLADSQLEPEAIDDPLQSLYPLIQGGKPGIKKAFLSGDLVARPESGAPAVGLAADRYLNLNFTPNNPIAHPINGRRERAYDMHRNSPRFTLLIPRSHPRQLQSSHKNYKMEEAGIPRRSKSN
jgi:hypothetical protein